MICFIPLVYGRLGISPRSSPPQAAMIKERRCSAMARGSFSCALRLPPWSKVSGGNRGRRDLSVCSYPGVCRKGSVIFEAAEDSRLQRPLLRQVWRPRAIRDAPGPKSICRMAYWASAAAHSRGSSSCLTAQMSSKVVRFFPFFIL